MNSLTLSFRNCGFASCLGLSFSENILQSLFSCVWNEELIPCTLLFLSAPNILHRTTAFQWLFVLRKKNIRSKVWFSRTAACMRRALLRVKEGDGCALSSLSLCLRNAHPSYCCSPLHLCNLSAMLCWAPWKESVCQHICSSPGDAEQQCGSGVQLAERKQLISLFYANANMFLLQSWSVLVPSGG